MKVTLKGTNINLTEELKKFIENEIEKIKKIVGKVSERAEFFIEIGRQSKHHKKGDVFYSEIQTELPKKILRAASTKKTLKEAIKTAKEKIERQIEKYKERIKKF
ncbi:MAG: ribosome hibernation-promoting factor, HPF/YfiA family [Minisyncoccia bacterium]